jgi:hypothetical protein
MGNFEFNSHIKVINGSVFKTFLMLEGIAEDAWEDEETVSAIRAGLDTVLHVTLAEQFDPAEETVGTVDWSYNQTYRPETFKTEVLRVSREHVCLYILVSPGAGNLARVRASIRQAVAACGEEQQWWNAATNMTEAVMGCRTHIAGFVFRLRADFLLAAVQAMPSAIASLGDLNPLESFTPQVTQPRTFFLTVTVPSLAGLLLLATGVTVCRLLGRQAITSLCSVNQRWYAFIKHVKYW